MKTIKSFEDLVKANDYITQMNEAYATEVNEKKSVNDKLKLTENNLSKAQSDLVLITDKHSVAAAALIVANDKITELNSIIESNQGNADLVIELQETLDQTLGEVSELGKKISLLEKNRGDNSLIVTVKGKSYKLLGNRFITKSGELNAEELSKNDAELQRMLKIGSGSLIPVE